MSMQTAVSVTVVTIQEVEELSSRYCIVGAGPAGLSMAAELRKRDIPYDHFERHSRVGGIWDLENPGSPMYESAHFISSKTRSGFLDFPMPDSYPDYPRGAQILEYLSAYAEHHHLGERIQFGTSITHVEPQSGSALVTVGGRTKRYRAVICASGTNWEPNLPELPGHFDGELRHAQTYRRSEEFSGKRVVVLGLGNSGADIACDAARVAKQTHVSVRRGYHVIPKHLFGMPTDVFANEGPHLPLWLERPLFTWLLRILVGDVTRLGMPRPDHGLLETHPLLSDQLLYHLRHGDLGIKPAVTRLDGHEVVFSDNSFVEADVILCATGYKRNIPYLGSEFLEGDWAAGHFLTCINRRFDSLFTLGFAELNGGLYPQLSRMANLIGQLAQHQLHDPDSAERFYRWARATEFDLTGGRKLVATQRHSHYCDEHALTAALSKALRWVSAPTQLPASKPLHSARTS